MMTMRVGRSVVNRRVRAVTAGSLRCRSEGADRNSSSRTRAQTFFEFGEAVGLYGSAEPFSDDNEDLLLNCLKKRSGPE